MALTLLGDCGIKRLSILYLPSTTILTILHRFRTAGRKMLRSKCTYDRILCWMTEFCVGAWVGGREFPKTNNIQIVKQITIFLYLPLLTQLLYTGILNVCVYNNCPV